MHQFWWSVQPKAIFSEKNDGRLFQPLISDSHFFGISFRVGLDKREKRGQLQGEKRQSTLLAVDKQKGKEMRKDETYDFFCTDCGEVTRQIYKGIYTDSTHLYVCAECGCENSEPLIENRNEYPITNKGIVIGGKHEQENIHRIQM